jgi:hypothetical protein
MAICAIGIDAKGTRVRHRFRCAMQCFARVRRRRRLSRVKVIAAVALYEMRARSSLASADRNAKIPLAGASIRQPPRFNPRYGPIQKTPQELARKSLRKWRACDGRIL